MQWTFFLDKCEDYTGIYKLKVQGEIYSLHEELLRRRIAVQADAISHEPKKGHAQGSEVRATYNTRGLHRVAFFLDKKVSIHLYVPRDMMITTKG